MTGARRGAALVVALAGVAGCGQDAGTTTAPAGTTVTTVVTTEPAPTTRSSVPATSTPAATTTTTPTPSAAPCDAATIGAALDRPEAVVEQCAGDFAFGATPVPGDSSFVARRSGGTWALFDVQPTRRCQAEARAEGVPEELVRYFSGPCGRGGGEGDLGLDRPVADPPCDGGGIVVLGSATDPASYAEDVARLLDADPDASYLRTDLSCPSLRASTDDGDPIYAVYRRTGDSRQEICGAVRAAGGDAYGKRLDTTTDPGSVVAC